MTVIEFVPDKVFTYGAFRISGHSGYAEAGSDIVCAYISSAAEFTLSLFDEFGVATELEIEPEDAVIKCRISSVEQNGEIAADISRIMNVFYSHILELCKQFPKNVKITERKILQ